jgi:hypothetical protein
MKHGTIKTLGVTALGAAFAATGAGVASAAPVHGSDAPTDVAMAPVQDVAQVLPTGAAQAFAAGGAALAAGTQTLPTSLGASAPQLMDTVQPGSDREAPNAEELQQRVQEQLAAHRQEAGPQQQTGGLLGGLPVGGQQNPANGGNAGLLGALPIGG